MRNESQKLICGLQKEITLLEEVVAAKNALINEQKEVILQQEAQINKLTDLLDEVLGMTK